MSIQIDQVRFVKVEVTPKTTWYFAEVVNSNGLETVVEFTKGTSSVEVAKLINQMIVCLAEKLVVDALLVKVTVRFASFVVEPSLTEALLPFTAVIVIVGLWSFNVTVL